VPSPKLIPLVLSDAERASLEALSRKRTASQSLAERARVVLACADEGGVAPLTRVAVKTGLSRESVRKWRVRFMERRLDGLGDAPRPGAARKITDEQVEVLVTRTLTEKGRGQDSHWSTRSMAAETGLSQSSVSRIWRAFGLKPHVAQTWKLSTDPEFIGKVRDVVGLYMSPPENALVLCVDEKSQIQALDRTAPCLPMLPTTPARMTHDYVRHDTTSLFAALDLASGSVIPQLDEPRRALVRRAHQPQAPPLSPPQRCRARDRHQQVDQRVEQEPEAVHLDQDGRRDPRNPRRLLPTHHRLRTLELKRNDA
jgi:transposase